MPQNQPQLDRATFLVFRAMRAYPGSSTVLLHHYIAEALGSIAVIKFYCRIARLRAIHLVNWRSASGWHVTTRGMLILDFLAGTHGIWKTIRSSEWPVPVDPPYEISGVIASINHVGTLVTLSGFWMTWDDLPTEPHAFQITLDVTDAHSITPNPDGSMTLKVVRDLFYTFGPAPVPAA